MSPPRFMRPRNNSRRGNSFNNPHRSIESHGPNGKIRGSAKQIMDQYMAQARDARASGDRVLEENLMQHADHYQRILNKNAEEQQAHAQKTTELPPAKSSVPQDMPPPRGGRATPIVSVSTITKEQAP